MKTPVVLLPALLCNAGLFIHQIKALENEYDFFVPDLGLDTSVEATAKRILSQIKGDFILGGVSMGGYVALEIMRQAPHRVQKLMLMDTNAHADAQALRQKRLEMIETARKDGIESVIEGSLFNVVSPMHRDNDLIRHILTHMAESTGVEKYANEQQVIMTRPDSTDFLKRIKCPVLIMGGKQDALSTPQAMDAMAAAVPSAVHVIIDNSGHLPPLENPAAVTATWRMFFEKAH